MDLSRNFEATLSQVFSQIKVVEPVRSALAHSLFPAGKRIRPMVALSLCSDLGGDPTKLFIPSSALELIHCSSLIHDDLPALDNDDMRRGKPSTHKAFGEATAILAGDLLVSQAFVVLSGCPLSPNIKLSMIEALSRGYVDVCNGQQLDLLPPGDRGDLGDLLTVHELKTGALFSVATRFAGLVAGLEGDRLESAVDVGLWTGILFQVIDDYLDVYGPVETTGRPKGSDARNQKITVFTDTNEAQGLAILSQARAELERRLYYFSGADRQGTWAKNLPMFAGVLQKIMGRVG